MRKLMDNSVFIFKFSWLEIRKIFEVRKIPLAQIGLNFCLSLTFFRESDDHKKKAHILNNYLNHITSKKRQIDINNEWKCID